MLAHDEVRIQECNPFSKPAVERPPDAILGVRELLEAHPDMRDGVLTTLLNACERLIGDEVISSLLSTNEPSAEV